MRDINDIVTYDEAIIACLQELEEDGCVAVDTAFRAMDLGVDLDLLIEDAYAEDIKASDYIKYISH